MDRLLGTAITILGALVFVSPFVAVFSGDPDSSSTLEDLPFPEIDSLAARCASGVTLCEKARVPRGTVRITLLSANIWCGTQYPKGSAEFVDCANRELIETAAAHFCARLMIELADNRASDLPRPDLHFYQRVDTSFPIDELRRMGLTDEAMDRMWDRALWTRKLISTLCADDRLWMVARSASPPDPYAAERFSTDF